MSRRAEWVAVVLILLLAAALRFWALGEVPPGLSHDEVANWLIARRILAGHHAIYFTAAYGHEPLYQYMQAAAVALFGDHGIGLRYSSAALGLLGLAVAYVLVRRLFGASVALLSSAWLATSFWPLFYARVGLRAIALPFTAALSAYFLLRAVDLPVPQSASAPARRSTRDWLLAGIFVGSSLYTYMAARVFPFILVAFLVYLFIVRRPRAPLPWSGILVFLLAAAVVFAPLATWLITHPEAEHRVEEVREPLDRLLAGDPALVWQNLIANLKFFTFVGDPWPHQGISGRPVFVDAISAVLFYGGLLVALWRWRDPRYGLLLIWLGGAMVPSIITSHSPPDLATDAPSSIRDILGVVVAFVFPALGCVEAGRWVLRQVEEVNRWRFLFPAFCLLLLAPCLVFTVRDYFVRWPRDDAVRYFYQTDLTAVARRLEELPVGTPIAVAGLSVHSLDGPTLELSARRPVGDVRLCDTRQTLLIPSGRDAWVFVPRVVPLDDDFRERLVGWGAAVEEDESRSFTGYHLPDGVLTHQGIASQPLAGSITLPGGEPVRLPVSFGGQLAFMGYERLQQALVPGGSIALLTYWRVETPPASQIKVFVHLLGESEEPVAQHDGLESPVHTWKAGDVVVQKHVVPLPVDLPAARYRLQVGVYDAMTGTRLPVLEADRLLLCSLEVTE